MGCLYERRDGIVSEGDNKQDQETTLISLRVC